MTEINNISLRRQTIIFSIFIYLFYFDQIIYIYSIKFDFRLSILLLIFVPFISKKISEYKKIVILFISFFFLFYTHSEIFSSSIRENYNFINIKNTLICLFISLLIFYKNIIYRNIYRVIYIFIVTFPFIYFFSRIFIFAFNDKYTLFEIFFFDFGELRTLVVEQTRIIGLPMLYKEPSHLNMISSFILINSFFLLSNIKKNRFVFLFAYTFFALIIIINLTSTFIYGYLLSILIIYLIKIRKINKKFIIYCLSIFFVSLFFSNYNNKIKEQYQDLKISLFNFEKLKYIEDDFENTNLSTQKESLYRSVEIKNLSYEVLLFNLKISVKSLQENLFGHGLNSYPQIHQKYKEFIPNRLEGSNWLNSTNGSNIFIKSLAEFGIISIILGILLLLFLFKRKFSYKKKIIIISGLMTVLCIRGAGYVSAGFLIFISFYFDEIYYLIKKNKIKLIK